jgi:hypothetical protein
MVAVRFPRCCNRVHDVGWLDDRVGHAAGLYRCAGRRDRGAQHAALVGKAPGRTGEVGRYTLIAALIAHAHKTECAELARTGLFQVVES